MKKGDFVIIIAILLLAFVGLFGKYVISQSTDERRVIITKDHVVLYDIPLTDKTNEKIKIEENNEYNLIVIENGFVNIIEANCKNQICVNDGKISKVGEILVCLPHKLTVEIKGKKSSVIDVISE